MLQISTPSIQGLFQAAKWLKIQALVDADELSLLFEMLGPFFIYPLGSALSFESFPMQKEVYLETYRSWIEDFKKGKIPQLLREMNASMWASSTEALWLQELPGQRYVARPRLPFLQVQVHQMSYSDVDRVFRSMSLSSESIFWGLQFSFPQVFQHPEKGFLEPEEFFDKDLFQKVRKWSREYTIATPMIVDGVRQNLPVRLGKHCFSWIHNHPQLKSCCFSVLELDFEH